MKKTILTLAISFTFASILCAGTEYSGKEMKQAVATTPCPEWYADHEWNISLWGAYLFTEAGANNSVEDFYFGNRGDRYLESDDAGGGGIDLKYFFHRYFGVGIEGWLANAERRRFDIEGEGVPNRLDLLVTDNSRDDSRLVGAVLGTLTLRYPFHCSRFAPYAFAGGGAIFGGGERDRLEFIPPPIIGTFSTPHHSDDKTEVLGQFGGGLEIRFTHHIGWTTDFSWNVVDGPKNNFGMVRSGVNFAF